jgi:predicted heme/steroid binding protein
MPQSGWDGLSAAVKGEVYFAAGAFLWKSSRHVTLDSATFSLKSHLNK